MFKKEIIILSGGSKKGICKLTGTGASQKLKGECSLDFAPTTATLYIYGDEISEITLSNRLTRFEINEYVSPSATCAVYLGSNLALSGTSGSSADKRTAITEIESYRDKKRKQSGGNMKPDAGSPREKAETLPKSVESVSDNPSDNERSGNCGKNAADFNDGKNDRRSEECGKNGNRAEISEDRREYAAATEKPLYGGEKGFSPRAFTLDGGVRYDGSNFYLAVKPQIDEMFICYPFEERLNAAVPNSKWVKIDAEDGYYVVGVLFSDATPTYICYGIPGEYRVKPPSDMEDMCVWLPLNAANEYGDGYWVIYQSAKDGKIVK